MDKVNNMLTEFLKTHGITPNWLNLELDIPCSSFWQYANETGFPDDIADRATRIVRAISVKLSKFKLTDDSISDFDYLKNECGIQHKHFWGCLGIRMSGSLGWRLKRGLTPEEKTLVMSEINNIAAACKKFKMPSEIIKKAA